MIWKMILSQTVAMVMLAITVLILRDCAKHREMGHAKWLYAVPSTVIMIWAIYLMLNESEAIGRMPSR